MLMENRVRWNIYRTLLKKLINNKIANINVKKDDKDCSKVAKDPFVSNFLFFSNSGMYFEVLSTILLNRVDILHQ